MSYGVRVGMGGLLTVEVCVTSHVVDLGSYCLSHKNLHILQEVGLDEVHLSRVDIDRLSRGIITSEVFTDGVLWWDGWHVTPPRPARSWWRKKCRQGSGWRQRC